jgi:hypothetical protein
MEAIARNQTNMNVNVLLLMAIMGASLTKDQLRLHVGLW